MGDAPTKAGRYEVVRELGRGSMGVVYEGFDPVIGRTVAIKTMLTEGLTPQEFQEFKSRFQREAQAAGVLSHPNIVNVFDYGEDSGTLYLIMEYLEGKSLEKLVEGQNILPIETIIPMYDQVCSALDHAHQHGIVHRDIKPANVMILDNGIVKVTDFGIAKMVSMGMTQAGQVLGTPNYMSPEQVKGRQIDGRSDIFSLGIILYDLVTGEMPFAGQNITTVIYKIINENPIPPRELDASIHPGLSYVICKALAKSPDERYQTCRELADDLKNFKYMGGPATPSATVVLNVPPLQGTGMERAAEPSPVGSPAPPLAPAEAARIAPQRTSLGQVPAEVMAPAPAYQKPRASPTVWIFMVLGVVILGIFGGAGYWYLHKGKPQVATPVGQLYVESNIPGARISVDGQSEPSWLTPYTIPDLPPGSHQVLVSKEGYANYQQAVSIEGGKTNSVTAGLLAQQAPEGASKLPAEHTAAAGNKGKTSAKAAGTSGVIAVRPPSGGGASATPKMGQLMVTANISGAKISVDGRSDPDWVTPCTITLAAGTHQVVASKEGYDDYLQSVTIEGGKSKSLNASLSAPTGEVAVVTTPPGLDVLIDDKPIGPSPAHASVVAGQHKCTIKGGGFTPIEKAFKVGSGVMTTVRVTLVGAAATGTVVVHTAPLGATVSADGAVVGRTPTSFKLSAGRHDLVISLSGYKTAIQVVEVTANGTVPLNIQLTRQ
jgi:serine/threonine-protein kinase